MHGSSYFRICLAWFGLGVGLASLPAAPAGGPIWVDDTHADFSRGRLSASGRNLHVTHAGAVKQVFRYDLNQDGWADLLFNSAHDFILAPPATLVDLVGDRPVAPRELPGIGARVLKTGDFDRDGRTDLLALEESRWVNPRNYLHVYWGSESGEWGQSRQTDLLAENAMDVEVLDWDGDGYTDIVLLLDADTTNPGGLSRRSLRVYWGSAAGFLQSDVSDLEASDLVEIESLASSSALLALADTGTTVKRLWYKGRRKLETDTRRVPEGRIGNLRVHAAGGEPLILASGEPSGHAQVDPTTARTSATWSHLVRLELKDDGSLAVVRSAPLPHSACSWDAQRPDLLLVADVSKAENSARLLTGFDPRSMRFEAGRVFSAPGYVSGVTLSHHDGAAAVVLASFRTDETYNTDSWVVPLEDALRGAVGASAVRAVRTQGATDVIEIKPGPADKWIGSRLAFLNRIAGSYVELVPTRIHWGSAEGFSPTQRLEIPFYSGIVGAGADLNDDGRPDLVLVSQVHNVHTPKPYMGLHVYSGTEQRGFPRSEVLPEYGVRGLAVADLDRDGWLDLVGSILNGPTERRGWVIWRGGADGFTTGRRVFIPFPLAHGLPAVADVDGDGWLDVAVPSMRGNEIRIYRNDHGQFAATRFDSLPAWQANQLDFADMNADGYIDLVSASGLGPGTFFRDYGIQIFWGGPAGYDPKRAQRLPAHGAVGFLIQDWDRDGHLDLFAPNYHSGIIREGTSARIYWGSATGLDSGRLTYLPVDGAAGAFAMDFDGDGTLDIAISSHTTDGSHHTQSPIYYNRDGRFGEPQRKVLLPTIGPQQMYSSGAGNQFDRTLREWYESAAIPLGKHREVSLAAQARIPAAAALRFSIRTAASEAALAAATWREVRRDEWQALPENAAVLQYRAEFIAGWRDAEYPELDRVEIRGR